MKLFYLGIFLLLSSQIGQLKGDTEDDIENDTEDDTEDVSTTSQQNRVMGFKVALENLHKRPPFSFVNTAAITPSIESENWITQPLDHFNLSNNATWRMRYFANTDNFQPHRPIFIMVGGEWEITADGVTGGHFYDISDSLNASIYYTEHRFYGKSTPTSDVSTRNLRFASSRQALADIATFINFLKRDPNMANSKVILASCSYGGNLATWFRKKYPNLATGAWASSAPLQATVQFPGYDQVVGDGIRKACGANVYNKISQGYNDLQNLLKRNPAQLLSKLNICSGFNTNNKLDVKTLFVTITNYFSGIIQKNSLNGIQNALCANFRNTANGADAVATFFKSFAGDGCTSITFTQMIQYFNQTNWSAWSDGSNFRAWLYQTCSEFGYYMTTSSQAPFGNQVSIDYYLQQCKDLFGITANQVYQNIAVSNNVYGALNPRVTNVFFDTGDLDPWKPLQMRNQQIIPLYSHCMDLQSISDSDTVKMRQVKQAIAKAITNWVK